VKLLFDENLSPKLAAQLSFEFPDSVHVSRVGLDQADDTTVWKFAAAQSFTIVTKDADFQELSLRLGAPPKVIWLRRGNCSVNDTVAMLRDHSDDVRTFLDDNRNAVLVITG
jgi:predicted nuclease of predicted toxin-antitoxin system